MRIFSRKFLGVVAGVTLVLVVGGIVLGRAFDAERRLANSWKGFIGSIESRSAFGISGYLAKDYSDTWGYSQATLSGDLPRIMASFSELKLALSDVTTTREGAGAVITARVKITANGYGYVSDATRQINGLAEPFVVRWRQDDSFPWTWRIVRIEQAQFDVSRYKRAGGGLRGRWPF